MATTIRSMEDDEISNFFPKTTPNFMSQPKLLTSSQIAEQCMSEIEDNKTF
jgi:hypothetical protein